MKVDGGDMMGRVDRSARVRQGRAAVATNPACGRVVSVVDLKIVRRAVLMFFQFEPDERQHQSLTRTASPVCFTKVSK